MNVNRMKSAAVLAASIGAALAAHPADAGTSTNTAGPVRQGQTDGGTGNPSLNNPMETISLSGSTAMKNFTISPGISLLSPGTPITLHNGTGGAAVTYYAPTGSSTSVQLASGNITSADTGVSGYTGVSDAPASQNHSALRLEWHEQGSVEGILDLTNDQIGYAGGAAGTPLVDPASRNPAASGIGNAIWVNRNQIYTSTGQPINGFNLNTASSYNTYDSSNYNLATGKNLQGGQNRVQMAISDVNAVQGFAVAGTPSVFAAPGTAGYGKGNPALAGGATPQNTGAVGGRQSLQDQTVLNMPVTNIDPQTGTNYQAGPWNSAGTNNLDNHQTAVTATEFVANPGTGLARVNRSDAQWLQTTGRLANGAVFDVSARDANSGTRNVAALNTGVDPSWAVGSNDGGNGNAANGATGQVQIGSALRFSGKTTGGQLAATVQNVRMGVGTLSLPDTNSKTGGSIPLRALDIANTASDPTSSGATDDSQFVRANFHNIVNGIYPLFQNETYVTVKDVNGTYGQSLVGTNNSAAWAAATDDGRNGTNSTGIKGDTTGDVQAFRNNILSTVANYPNNTSSVANPADQLLNKGFMLPQLMSVEKQYDGGPLFSQNLTPDQQTLQNQIGTSSLAANFTPGPNALPTITAGTGATYGNAGGGPNGTVNGAIAITDNGSGGGNWLFGNFNQNGSRDFSSVKSAVAAELALYPHGVSMFTGTGQDVNGTAVSYTKALDGSTANLTKGDLIVMGDFNGDGQFDGKDILAMARGASLADSVGNDRLTTASGPNFADQVRSNTAVLHKNDALAYVQSNTSDGSAASNFIRTSARNAYQAEHGTNADGSVSFNKLDVDHSGVIDRNDAAIVDKFIGKSYTNLSDVLGATINQGSTASHSTGELSQSAGNNQYVTSGPQIPFNLVDANLTDGKTTIDESDFAQVRTALGSALLGGDANFDGTVDFTDFQILGQHFGLTSGSKWSFGDFNLDGSTDFTDFQILGQNYGLMGSSPAQLASIEAFGRQFGYLMTPNADGVGFTFTPVPEPTAAGLMLVAAGGLAFRRRRCSK